MLRIAQRAVDPPPKALKLEVTVLAPREALGFPAEIAPEDVTRGLLNWWRAKLVYPESRALIDMPP